MPGLFSNNWFRDAYHPTDQRIAGGYMGDRLNSLMGDMSGLIGEYRNAPKFDANSIGRGIDQSYFNSVALQPSVASNLKGMGVNAAEGQAALMQSLPLMQARAEGKSNLARDQYQAQQAYLMNLANLIGQRTQTGLAGEGLMQQMLQLWANIDLNK